MSKTPTIPAAPTPVWATIDEEILCPLCEYNLRGLPEPRCPECGYRFDWPDLLDPTRRKHPFVFEHHPRRNLWSLYRTLRAGLKPTRFWRSLHPAQPASLKRLVWYVLIVATFVFAVNLADMIGTAVTLSTNNQGERTYLRATLRNPALAGATNAYISANFSSVDEWLDAMAPPTCSLGFARDLARELGETTLGTIVSGIYLTWPLLSLAALLIFRWSMRRAKVRTIHIFRCIAYAFDTTVWVVIAYVGAAAAWDAWGMSSSVRSELLNLELLFVPLSLVAMTYRLYVGYKVYLQFDRPLATTVASQVIVALVMLKLVSLTLLGT